MDDTKLKEIKIFINQDKYKNIFVITGKNSFIKSGANKIFEKLLFHKKKKIYYKREFIPKLNELKKIIEEISIFKPDLILAIGGGTVIDYAKCANCLSKDVSEKNIISGELKLKKISELCAIPTTAGSGAEVTENAVLYIQSQKYSVEDKLIKPDQYFLVPEFVKDSKIKLKATSGFDAISQAIESILSIKSNEESINFSKKSLFLSLNSYKGFVNNPNLENTKQMCLAANLSGKAISIARTTAPHAVSYPFTSIFNVSHGHAVALTLSKFLKFNYINIQKAEDSLLLKKKFQMIFEITKTKSIQELYDYIEHLKSAANLEGSLKKLNIEIKKDYEKIISGINIMRLKNNPVPLSQEVIKEILFSLK